MEMKQIPGEEMNPEAVDAFANKGYPIPGQSWTQDVEERRPFEGKPDFVDMQAALVEAIINFWTPCTGNENV